MDILPKDKALDLLQGDLPRYAQTQADGLALCPEFGFLTLAIDVAGKILSLELNGPGDLLAIVREKGPREWSNDADEDNLLGHLRATGDGNGEAEMRAAIGLAERILGHGPPTVKAMKSWL